MCIRDSLRAMRQAGYAVDVPESGAALIETIMAVSYTHLYLTYGGAENLGNLFRFLDALPDAAAVPEPVPVPWEGLWHPDAPVRAFATVRGYLEWYAGYARERGLSLDPERTVGLLFGRHYWVNDMPDVEAALVHALEAKGLGVFPAFTNTLRDKARCV